MREKILELLLQRPFQPFRVQLSNSNAYVIRHPEQAILAPGYLFVGIPRNDAPGPLVRDVVSIALLHIAEVSPLLPTTAPAAN